MNVFDPTTQLILSAVDAQAKPRLGPGRIGASQIGGDPREVWLAWRWCLPQNVDARTRMIWRHGDLIETELVRLLRQAGLEVIDREQGGDQIGYTALGGHYAMRLDGVVRGLPEAPGVWHTLEAKSMANKYHTKLCREGLKAANPEYHAQCQTGMHHAGLARCLFIAYNKDTSALYIERIRADQSGAAIMTKALDVAQAEGPPESSYPDESWWKIKWRPDRYKAIYWGRELPPTPNCRNCRFSTPILKDTENRAQWLCGRHNVTLSHEQQQAGCIDHNWIPALVPAKLLQIDIGHAAARYERDGVEFWNVPHGQHQYTNAAAYTSAELTELSKVDFRRDWIEDPLARGLRQELGATIDEIEPAKKGQQR